MDEERDFTPEEIERRRKAVEAFGPVVEENKAWADANPWAGKDEVWSRLLRNSMALGGQFSQRDIDLWVCEFTESDRGYILVAATILDQELEALLRDFFAMMAAGTEDVIHFFLKKRPVPPFQSTAMKIRLAFVLGLIDKPVFQSLSRFQEYRSTVAAHTSDDFVIREGTAWKILEPIARSGENYTQYLLVQKPDNRNKEPPAARPQMNPARRYLSHVVRTLLLLVEVGRRCVSKGHWFTICRNRVHRHKLPASMISKAQDAP